MIKESQNKGQTYQDDFEDDEEKEMYQFIMKHKSMQGNNPDQNKNYEEDYDYIDDFDPEEEENYAEYEEPP